MENDPYNIEIDGEMKKVSEHIGIFQLVIEKIPGLEEVKVYDFVEFTGSDEISFQGTLIKTATVDSYDVGLYRIDFIKMMKFFEGSAKNNLSFKMKGGYNSISDKEEFALLEIWEDEGACFFNVMAVIHTKKHVYWFYENIVKRNLPRVQSVLNNEDLYEKLQEKYEKTANWYRFKNMKECLDHLKEKNEEISITSGEEFIDFTVFDSRGDSSPIASIENSMSLVVDLNNLMRAIIILDSEETDCFQFPGAIQKSFCEMKKQSFFCFDED